MKYPIGPGSRVTLHLSLTLEDGTVAESTFGEMPHRFTLGDGSLLPGLEFALYGLRPGATQRLVLSPEQAYGQRDPAQIRRLPRAGFDAAITLEPGVIIGFENPQGEELAATVLAVEGDSVEVDFNHPLAGHAITFAVEILEVIPAQE
jgi:FKBP-type peptidyl-prolyl cis-trans isomerase SlpA